MRALISLGALLLLLASGCSSSPKCGPDTCSGCCDKGGKCQAGDTDTVCGGGGKTCGACPSGTTCYFRVCAIGSNGGGTGGSGGGTGGGTSTGGGSATGGGSGFSPTTHFAALTHWPVPDSTTTGGFYAPNVSQGGSVWALIDVDGDHKPDLVQTADPSSTGPTPFTDAGSPYWRVYKNSGSGFSTTPTVWSLPPQANPTEFNSATGGDGKTNWATIDLTGDGTPELVRTVDPDAGTPLPFDGGTGWYWQTFAANGSRFSATPGTWNVPESGSPNGFDLTQSNTPSAHWSVFDLNGDGKKDLVMTSDPASSDSVFTSMGMPFWKVWLNEGGGFSATPTTWPVPLTPTAGGFYTTATTGQLRNWALFDLDGDGAPELVQTSDPTKIDEVFGFEAPPTVWYVYLNSGITADNFLTTPNMYAVPDSQTDGGFYTPAIRANNLVWATLDLTSDKKADLIQTCDPKRAKGVFGQDAGTPFWKVFPAGAGGFGAEIDFPVPDSGTAAGFYSPFGGGGTENWSLIDLDGDGRLDLVQTSDPAAGNNTVFGSGNNPEWHVWRGVP